MTLRTNYHTHSHYDDGEGEIEDYVLAAIAAGYDSMESAFDRTSSAGA